MDFKRGSEWRKWDLHVHTPASYDYKNLSVTNQDIINTVSNNNVSVIAITDHHVIDVERIIDLQTLGKEKQITVLPGIEILSDARGSEPIHFIGIFPETKDIAYIWGQLENRTNIKKIKGENLKYNEIYCDLDDTIKLIKELGGLVSIHAGSKSNSLESITNSLPHTMAQKSDIARNIDIYELGKEEDQTGYREIVFPTIKKSIPMILCSDNHNIKEYHIKQNCWIKANPTFDGLKQIIFEPDDRVRIQEEIPEIKSDYQIIDKVEIKNSEFSDKEILFNQNLNTIIGGRSSGKSLLLGCIAKSIQSDIQVKEDNDDYNRYIESIYSNFKVYWKDGENSSNRDIEYFRQSYINKIAYKSEELNKLITESIIKRDIVRKQYFDDYKEFCIENKHKINQEIATFFSFKEKLIDKQKELKEKGNKEGIEKEIEKIKSELSDIKSSIESNLTPEQENEYQKFMTDLSSNKSKLKNLQDCILQIDKLVSLELFYNLDDELFISDQTILSDIKSFYDSLKQKFQFEWSEGITKFKEKYEKEIALLNQSVTAIESNEAFNNYQKYYTQNKSYSNHEARLNEENSKLVEFNKIDYEITLTTDKIKSIKENIIQFSNQYFNKISELCENVKFSKDDLEIYSIIHFKNIDFIDAISDRFNQKSKLVHELINYQFISNDDHVDFINKIFNHLEKNDITLKGGSTSQQVLIDIFSENYFDLDFDVKYQNDRLSEMSEGKKAFVILRILLDFNEKKCPILIDQPEDDLDNRAIYDELVRYIRVKKKDRQIILVTHNPNIVVSADAEEIIVANQHGKTSENENCVKFDYISGSLENTFERIADCTILKSQGIKQHVCEILEGGDEAFKKREEKYQFMD